MERRAALAARTILNKSGRIKRSQVVKIMDEDIDLSGNWTWKFLRGETFARMRQMPDDYADSFVVDPPYGLSEEPNIAEVLTHWLRKDDYKHKSTGFMGTTWDSFVPGPHVWREAYRVLKPGGHLLCFASSRTFDLMGISLRMAGFEIRDTIAWIYGCLSEDTEVLTPDGWELYHVAKHKAVLAYDPETDDYQWETPRRWSEYHVDSDTAYRIESDSTDQIVSRNHRCLVERDGALVFVRAEDCAGVESVPVLPDDFRHAGGTSGDVLQQAVQRRGAGSGVGIVWAQGAIGMDGCVEGIVSRQDDGGEQPGVEGRAHLLQEEGEVRRSADQIRSMSGSGRDDGAQGRIRHGASLARGGSDRAAVDASGVRSPRQSRRDGQPDRELNVVCDERGPQAVRVGTSYRTTLATVIAFTYSGMIFCPTVSTGAFVARRNGKVFVTGNSGFPKSIDVSQNMEKYITTGLSRRPSYVRGLSRTDRRSAAGAVRKGDDVCADETTKGKVPLTTEEAKRWAGWGTCLKPAFEPIIICRKPMEHATYVNMLKHDTGGINVDACRVPTAAGDYDHSGDDSVYASVGGGNAYGWAKGGGRMQKSPPSALGRWPANAMHDGSGEVQEAFAPFGVTKSGAMKRDVEGYDGDGVTKFIRGRSGPANQHGDSGSVSRFFYCAKSSKRERNAGLPEGMKNTHPTVKSLELMRWLVRLVTPPGGVCVDNYAGSGTTGCACMLEGVRFIGIERQDTEKEPFVTIAKHRVRHWKERAKAIRAGGEP